MIDERSGEGLLVNDLLEDGWAGYFAFGDGGVRLEVVLDDFWGGIFEFGRRFML